VSVIMLGIDPSVAACGVARWDEEGDLDCYTFKSDPADTPQERWASILENVWGLCSGYGRSNVFCVIEQPPAQTGGRSGGSPLLTIGLWAVLTFGFARLGRPFLEVQPNTIKKFAIGKGAGAGTSKEDVLLNVERRYGHLVKVRNNNEADAFAALAMGLWHYGNPLVDLPAMCTERVNSLPWPEWDGIDKWKANV
jgi:Holliday junction resolvasome RuvABC endonuclease subunit